MAKERKAFECRECGYRSAKWLGRCTHCGAWNSFFEIKEGRSKGGGKASAGNSGESRPLSLASIAVEEGVRLPCGLIEMDRVLGGGLMRGSSVLLGGEPGIGKSTLMLQLCQAVRTGAGRGGAQGSLLYISGEESAAQIKLRARRLGVDRDIEVYCEHDSAAIRRTLEERKPGVVIVDSIQTLVNPDVGVVPGTVNQIKFCADDLITWTRQNDSALFLIAHVNKEGAIAGPKVLEHMVDTVLSFEQSRAELRIIRALKNRFGSVDELGLFRMTAAGLEQVENPASVFLTRRKEGLPGGVATAAVYEGSRVLLLEVQALTVPAKGGVSRVFSDRIDQRRVSRVAAVLEKHLGLRFSDQDIYINIAGGLKTSEVGLDLPLAMALYSARTDLSLSDDVVLAGEVSLAGEIMATPHMERRCRAAAELGFRQFVGPAQKECRSLEGYRAAPTVRDSVASLFRKRESKDRAGR